MSLFDTVGTWVLDNLAYDRGNPEVVAALKAKSPFELLIIYLNSRSRFVDPLPRQVLRSSAFDANPVVSERREAIAAIIQDIERGNLLTKYLSERVGIGFELPIDPQKKQLNRRKDLDLLLNEWGIYHLHISTEIGPTGFVKRTKPLIFAIFKPAHAYLIDVMEHGRWADDHLIRVVVEAWPNAGLVSEMLGILSGKNRWSNEERLQLRGAGIATSVAIDGRAYLPGPGMSSDGSSPTFFFKARQVLRALKNFEDQKDKLADKIVEAIKQKGRQIEGTPEYRFSVFENGYGVIETKSGVEIPLGK